MPVYKDVTQSSTPSQTIIELQNQFAAMTVAGNEMHGELYDVSGIMKIKKKYRKKKPERNGNRTGKEYQLLNCQGRKEKKQYQVDG